MKKWLSPLLILVMLIGFAGCSIPGTGKQDLVTLYYKRDSIQYFESESIVVAEPRELSGHARDLKYLLTIYLAGPLDESLVSPFPRGTALKSLTMDKNGLILTLSDLDEGVTDVQYTLGCACLTLTCLDFYDYSTVTVLSGQRSLTLNRDMLLLEDISEEMISTEDTQ